MDIGSSPMTTLDMRACRPVEVALVEPRDPRVVDMVELVPPPPVLEEQPVMSLRGLDSWDDKVEDDLVVLAPLTELEPAAETELRGSDRLACKQGKQESLANAMVSARQPWYRTQLTKSART